jgi:photosystem II stability/assembly factor-like uncharacterized protein
VQRSRARRGCALVVVFIFATACTASESPRPPETHAGSPSAPTASASPPPSKPPVIRTHLAVIGLEVLSDSFAVATLGRCRVRPPIEICRPLLAVTDDLGHTWRDITPSGVPAGMHLGRASFSDPGHGLVVVVGDDCAGGRSLLYRTSDGGRTWRRTSGIGATCNAGAGVFPDVVAPNVVFLNHYEPTGSSGELFRSIDGGATWSHPMELPLEGGLVGFTSADDGWFGGSEIGGSAARRTIDGGRTWLDVDLWVPPCCSKGIVSASPPSFFGTEGVLPDTVRGKGRWRVVFHISADGGDSWHPAAIVRPSGPAPLANASTSIVAPDTWWLASENGAILNTVDGGTTWRLTQAPDGVRFAVVEPLDGERAWLLGYVAREPALFLTSDHGLAWRRIVPDVR